MQLLMLVLVVDNVVDMVVVTPVFNVVVFADLCWCI